MNMLLEELLGSHITVKIPSARAEEVKEVPFIVLMKIYPDASKEQIKSSQAQKAVLCFKPFFILVREEVFSTHLFYSKGRNRQACSQGIVPTT